MKKYATYSIKRWGKAIGCALMMACNTSYANTHTIQISGCTFTPDSTTAVTGDTIFWVWVVGANNFTSFDLPPGAYPLNGFINITDTFFYIVNVPGLYYYYSGVDQAPCTGIINVSSPAFSTDVDTIQIACSGSTIRLNPSFSGLQPPYSYTWQVIAGDTLSCTTCSQPYVAIYQISTYFVQVTDTFGDTARLHVTYVLDSLIYPGQVIFTDSFTHCMGSTIFLRINNAFSPGFINWYDGIISPFDAVPGDYVHHYYQPGIYDVSVTDSLRCTVMVHDTIPNMDLQNGSYLYDTTCSNVPYTYRGHTYTSSGYYNVDTFTNMNGCDSIIELILTVIPAPVITFYHTTCSNVPYIYNGHTYDASGSYNVDTLTNMGGCDSIIVLQLWVDSLSAPGQIIFTDSLIHCLGDLILLNIKSGFPSGIIDWDDGVLGGFDSVPGAYWHYYVRPGNYIISVHDSLGCTVQVRDTIPNFPFQNYVGIWDTTCSNVPYIYNGHTYNASGTYYDTLTNVGGCDSIIGLWLTVKTAPVVTLSWDSMIGPGQFNVISDTNSMLDNDTVVEICGPPLQISLHGGMPAGGIFSGLGISNNIFTVNPFPLPFDTITYTYTDNKGCSASAFDIVRGLYCVSWGIQQIPSSNLFTLYPNPADDYLMIDFNAAYTGSTISVKDITGRELIQTKLTTSPQQLPTGTLPPGVYMVTLNNNGQTAARLLVKQ